MSSRALPKRTATQRELQRLVRASKPKPASPATTLQKLERKIARERLELTLAQDLRASALVWGYSPQYRIDWQQTLAPGIYQPHKGFFDFAIWYADVQTHAEIKIAIEVEGGTWTDGRHTRGKGYSDDCLKYNAASKQGWTLLRFSADLLGMALAEIEDTILIALMRA